MDTWHILEQRFHDIGNRDQCVAMTFEDEEDSDKCWYYLQGPPEHYAGNGVWRHVLYGKPMEGAPKTPPILEKDDYSHEDLHQTLLRAGRLLNLEDGKSDGDFVGSHRFVKLVVQHYGSPVTGLLFEDGDAKFFTNAARACGMLAGKLAARQVLVPVVSQSDGFGLSLGLIVSDSDRTIHRLGPKYAHLEPIPISRASWALLMQLLASGKNGVTRKQLAAEFKIKEHSVSQRKNDLKNKLSVLDITIPGDEFRLESLS